MRVLLTGASGQLGAYLLDARPACELIAWSHSSRGSICGVTLEPIDLANPSDVEAAFAAAAPDVVLHAAAVSRIDRCYQDPALARQVNAQATGQLVGLAARRRSRLVYVSTDMVFAGDKGEYYLETDPPAPLSQYGRSKLLGEQQVLQADNTAVARMSLLLGLTRKSTSFFDLQYRALAEGRPLDLFIDEWRTPLDMPTAARALWELAVSRVTGLLHIGGPQRLSRYDVGVEMAKFLRADPALIRAANQQQVSTPEPRPRDLSLDSSRWRSLFPQIPWWPWTVNLREQLLSRRTES